MVRIWALQVGPTWRQKRPTLPSDSSFTKSSPYYIRPTMHRDTERHFSFMLVRVTLDRTTMEYKIDTFPRLRGCGVRSDLRQPGDSIQAARRNSHQEMPFRTSATSSRTSSIVTTWKRLPLPSDFRTMRPLDREITFSQLGTNYKSVHIRMRWKFRWPFGCPIFHA
jgi:hypothetical protein